MWIFFVWVVIHLFTKERSWFSLYISFDTPWLLPCRNTVTRASGRSVWKTSATHFDMKYSLMNTAFMLYNGKTSLDRAPGGHLTQAGIIPIFYNDDFFLTQKCRETLCGPHVVFFQSDGICVRGSNTSLSCFLVVAQPWLTIFPLPESVYDR